MTRRLSQAEAAKVLQRASAGEDVDPKTLREAKATAKDHYAANANDAMREKDRRQR